MRLNEIGFIIDKYINLVIAYFKCILFISTSTEIVSVSYIYFWLTNMQIYTEWLNGQIWVNLLVNRLKRITKVNQNQDA